MEKKTAFSIKLPTIGYTDGEKYSGFCSLQLRSELTEALDNALVNQAYTTKRYSHYMRLDTYNGEMDFIKEKYIIDIRMPGGTRGYISCNDELMIRDIVIFEDRLDEYKVDAFIELKGKYIGKYIKVER